ncbi:MAG TPA: peptide-methionine (R)-S-oxide reductase MsrB [Fimbriimonas sp.]|nr:peptide-methionine (R)-S-oxide reductase MsrB [Fimbriimonas sp.]
MKAVFWVVVGLFVGLGCVAASTRHQDERPLKFKVVKTDAEWRKLLPADSYEVLRHAGTEAAFSSPLEHNHGEGVYYCLGCGQPLFSSKTKFDSGTGWPSFFKPLSKSVVVEKRDLTMGMDRTEVLCSRCGGHLGHVFDDGPAPTGLRFCMNGVALKFKKSPQSEEDRKEIDQILNPAPAPTAAAKPAAGPIQP